MKTEKMRPWLLAGTAVLLSLVALLVGCDESSSAIKEPGPNVTSDAGGSSGDVDAGSQADGAPKDCFDNPTTHFEIINACTNATRITKNPTLNKLLPDGGLPPLN